MLYSLLGRIVWKLAKRRARKRLPHPPAATAPLAFALVGGAAAAAIVRGLLGR